MGTVLNRAEADKSELRRCNVDTTRLRETVQE